MNNTRLIKALCICACAVIVCMTIVNANNATKLDITDDEVQSIQSSSPKTIADIKEAPAYFECPLAHNLQDILFDECTEKGVDPALMIAIMAKESNFNAQEISKTNDYGLMQINACHKAWLESSYGISDLLDPAQNIKAGAIMLSNLSAKYTDIESIAMAYNLGDSGAEHAFADGIYSTNYSREVASNYSYYAGQNVKH